MHGQGGWEGVFLLKYIGGFKEKLKHLVQTIVLVSGPRSVVPNMTCDYFKWADGFLIAFLSFDLSSCKREVGAHCKISDKIFCRLVAFLASTF